MGHKYVKEEDTFSTSRNGTVPKPTAQEVSDGKYLKANGTWETPSGGGGGGGSYPEGVAIYLGSQVLIAGEKSTTSTRQNIWVHYRQATLFPYPITPPTGYSIKYKLSAAGSTSNGNSAIVGINGVDLVDCGVTWTGNDNDFTNVAFSSLFDENDIPHETAYKYGTTTDALNLYIKSSTSGMTAYLNNITLHYYLVKNT